MNKLHFNLSQKGLILVALPLAFELVFVAILFGLLIQSRHEALKESSAKETVLLLNELDKLDFDAASALVGYGVTKNKTFGARFDQLVRQARQDVHALKTRVTNNPPQLLRATRIDVLERQALDLLDSKKKALDQGGTNLISSLSPDLPRLLTALTTRTLSEIHELAEGENAVQKESASGRSRSEMLVFGCLSAGVALNIVLAVSLAMFFNRGTTRRLGILLDNTFRLTQQKSLNPPLAGSDEIAHLDRTFHEMAVALAEAIRREKAAVENAVDIICSIDKESRFLAVNPAVERFWGYKPDKLIGRDLIDLIAPEEANRARQLINDVMAGAGTVTFENRVSKADGSFADMLWSAHWSDKDKALFCVVHDITDRKELDRLKRDFVAMVSHDLRTPLNSMQAVLSLIGAGAYGELSETGRESVSATEQDIERLIGMVNDLLDVEKMESGKLDMDFDTVRLVDVLWRATQAVSGLAESNSINVKVIPTKAEIMADADRLIQVVVNLASNAIKFSPKETTVTLSAVEEPKSVLVKVADRGRGIPVEMKEAIFERFKQVEKQDARGRKGAGLGLAICKAIVEQHNGEIGVDSEEGKGSTFWFRIPRHQSMHPANPEV